MLVCVRSSCIPTVKWFLGSFVGRWSKIALTIAGVNSFDDNLYRPPTILGVTFNSPHPLLIPSYIAVTQSRYKGSPALPGSFVRSRTAISRVVEGRDSIKRLASNGRYKRTLTKPTLSPCLLR